MWTSQQYRTSLSWNSSILKDIFNNLKTLKLFNIPNRDKHKEKARQEEPEKFKKAKPVKLEKNKSWSNNREKQLKKQIKLKKKILTEKKRKHEFTDEDLKELESDFRQLKKLKRK